MTRRELMTTVSAIPASVTRPNAPEPDFDVRDRYGRPISRVAGAPAPGTYSHGCEIITFNAADAGCQISYRYTAKPRRRRERGAAW